MKKRRTAALLALILCTAELLPVTAADEAEVFLPAEEAQAVEDMPIEADEMIEELLPITETETEAEAELPLSETEEFSDGELAIDLSGAIGASVVDLPETADDVDNEPGDTAAWSAAPAADTEQAEIPIDEKHFPDENFRSYLETIDKDKSKGFSADELAKITEIDVIGKNISDLTGIAYFTALETLQCDNNALAALDVSQNTKLKTLTCSGNQLTALNLNSNSRLISLVCSDNQITNLDLSMNKNLQDLRCARNDLSALDVSGCPLVWTDCSENKLTSLEIPKRTNLQYLFCNGNALSSLDVSGAAKLQWLECNDNQLTILNLTDALNVYSSQDSAVNLLNCADNRLTSLNINNKSYFKGLVCSGNMLSELDLSADPDLRQLECANNALTSLDVTKNTKLQTMDCSGNHLTSLDLSKLSITETTVLPNCSGQNFTINLTETDSGYQADLSAFVGNSALLRLSEAELENCAEKSVLGNLILLTQEGELEDSILTFPKGSVPETIELVRATGYKKKAWETDLLLELNLHCHIHNIEQVEKVPSCTVNGLLQEICTECNAVVKETILPATGHSYDAFTVTREATVFETGVKSRTCTVCGFVQDETIAKLNNGTLALTIGDTLKLKPLLTAISGQKKVSYKSSNKKVATVSAKGIVKGNKKGSAKITVKSGSKKYVVKVKVSTPAVQKIKHVPAKKKLRRGKTFQLKPRLAPTGCSQKVTYRSSNRKVATVTAKGKVKAKRKGSAKITITAGNVKKVCRIIVR